MQLTKFQIRALTIIRDNPDIDAGAFACELWPKSNMHRKVSNQGNGACRGKAAWLCGGSHAMKLVHAGLVRDGMIGNSLRRGYRLTLAGKEALRTQPEQSQGQEVSHS